MRLYLTLRFDRPIDKNKHYISPGGYEIVCKNGRTIGFDFEDYEGSISTEDHTVLTTVQKNLDETTFPEAADLSHILKNEEFDRFTEFYVYTGEFDEPEILLQEVLDVCFELDDGTTFELTENQLRQVNELIQGNEAA